MFRIVLILLLLKSYSGLAQNKLPFSDRQLFTVNYSYLSFQNKRDVQTIEGTKNFLTANNTTGYMVGIGYEYTNCRNIVFTANTMYGIQRHDLAWKFTFEDFDPNLNFGGYSNVHRFIATNRYFANVFMIGYNYTPKKTPKIKLQPKAGIGIMHRFGETKERLAHLVFYSPSPGFSEGKQHAYTDADAGTWGDGRNDRIKLYCFSLNGSYVLNTAIIKEIGIGIQYMHVLQNKKRNNGINSATGFYYNGMGVRDGIQIYGNQFRSVAITAKIGF